MGLLELTGLQNIINRIRIPIAPYRVSFVLCDDIFDNYHAVKANSFANISLVHPIHHLSRRLSFEVRKI